VNEVAEIARLAIRDPCAGIFARDSGQWIVVTIEALLVLLVGLHRAVGVSSKALPDKPIHDKSHLPTCGLKEALANATGRPCPTRPANKPTPVATSNAASTSNAVRITPLPCISGDTLPRWRGIGHPGTSPTAPKRRSGLLPMCAIDVHRRGAT